MARSSFVESSIVRLLENCDNPSNFVVTSSSLGGLGSGGSIRLGEIMKDIAPKMCITKVCHTLPGDLNIAKDPLSGNSTLKTPILAELNSALGIYNVGIYLSKEPETCDMSLLYDNVALYNTTMNLMSLHSYIQDVPGPSKQTSESFSSKCVTPVSTTVPLTYTALNDTTAVLMGALTCPNRYPESRHSFPDAPQKTGVWSLDSLATALVPMGGYPFICGGFSPMHPDHPSAEEQRPSFGLKPRNGKTNFASQTAAKSTSEQGNELGTVTLSQNLAMGDSQDRSAAETRKTSLRDLCWDLFKPDNTLLTFSPYTGHYLKSLVVFRGKECTPQALISYLSSMGEHPLIQQWRGRQPFRVHCHTYKHAENNLDMSVAWFGVHTGIAYTLKTLAQTIENLHSRRAYVASLGDVNAEEVCDSLITLAEEYRFLESTMAQKRSSFPSHQKNLQNVKFLWA